MKIRCCLLVVLAILCFTKSRADNVLKIHGAVQGDTGAHSLLIRVWKNLYSSQKAKNIEHFEKIVKLSHGKFDLEIPSLENWSYCSVGIISNSLAGEFQVLERVCIKANNDIGLSIAVDCSKFNPSARIKFSGKNAMDWEIQYKLKQMEAAVDDSSTKRFLEYSRGTAVDSNSWGILQDIKLAAYLQLLQQEYAFLKLNAGPLGKPLQEIILANAKGRVRSKMDARFFYDCIRRFTWPGYSKMSEAGKTIIKEKQWAFYWRNLARWNNDSVPAKSLSYAADYLSWMLERQLIEINMIRDSSISPYKVIISRNQGPVRDKLLANYFLEYYELMKNGDTGLREAQSVVSDEDARVVLQKLWDYQHNGAVAYNFELPDSTGNIRQLAEFKGKVVLVDFWFTGCTACEKIYSRMLKPIAQHFKDEPNLVLVSINVDMRRAVWLKSVNGGKYTGAHTVNLYTDGRAETDPTISNFNVSGYPRTMLIGKDGKIFMNELSTIDDQGKMIEIINSSLLQ